MATRVRRVSVEKSAPKDIDYGLIKSLIRDEVTLQVDRKLRTLVKPLYEVIMANDDSGASGDPSLRLPEWAVDLLRDADDDSGDLICLTDVEDEWS